jgi:uncharacterized membrane protein YgcG
MPGSRCVRRLVRLTGAWGAVAACASVHALPSPPAAPGASPLPLKLEYARLGIFTSVHDDVEVERVFVSPIDQRTVLVTATGPKGGVFATSDGGLTWSFAEMDLVDEGEVVPASDGSRARLFRDAIFDPADPRRIFARTERRLLRSEDGGATWTPCALEPSSDASFPIDETAVAGPSLLVASGRYLYSSEDAGRTFVKRPIRVEGIPEDDRVRVRSIAVDPSDPRRIAIALHAVDDGIDIARRIGSALDGTSDLGLAALALVDSQDPRPQRFSLGSGPSGVIVSADGGIEWQRAGLALDAWLVARRDAIYALSASPVLEAATLARQRPALAEAVRDQMRGLRIDVNAIRGAFAFPGRERLLLGPLATAPLFKSTDGGFTWVRVFAQEAAKLVALRPMIDRQRAGWLDPPVTAPGPARQRGGGGPPGGGGRTGGRGRGGRRGGGGGGGGGGAPRQAPQRGSAEMTLAYLDPVRLLSRYNEARPLTGAAAAGGGALLGFMPSEAYWSRLADAAISSSDVAGEISLGPGYPSKDVVPPQAFELLHSADGGSSWEAAGPPASDFGPREKGRRPPPYPQSIASAGSELILVLANPDREHRVLHSAWRWTDSDQRL